MKKLMKRGLSLLLCLAAALSRAACGGQGQAGEAITCTDDLDGKVVGVFSGPMTEEEFAAVLNERLDITLDHAVMVPSASELTLLVQNGQAQAGFLSEHAAQYIVARNPELSYIPFEPNQTLDSSMVLARDSGLRESVDQALAALEEDGALDALRETWLSEEAIARDPEPEELPPLDGAETIRVGVSGALPPMDYVTAEGKPGGFNVALMGEVARRLGVNVEFVTMDSESKFMALSSGTIDLFFWHFYEKLIPANMEAATPYLTENMVFLVRAPEA